MLRSVPSDLIVEVCTFRPHTLSILRSYIFDLMLPLMLPQIGTQVYISQSSSGVFVNKRKSRVVKLVTWFQVLQRSNQWCPVHDVRLDCFFYCVYTQRTSLIWCSHVPISRGRNVIFDIVEYKHNRKNNQSWHHVWDITGRTHLVNSVWYTLVS